MSSRISERFKSIVKSGKKALIPYITAGIPSLDKSLELALRLEDVGADLLEIGIPFSDPVADGTIIQRASQIALNGGINTGHAFELADRIRMRSSIPIIFMVYFNCVFKFGIDKFVAACVTSGVDGMIVPDLPFEESCEIRKFTEHQPVDVISLATPSSKGRLKRVLSDSQGFVYCVSTLGVTGERKNIDCGLSEFLDDVASVTQLPRAVGFGLSSREQIIEVKNYCEGVIVGSALMRRVMENGLDDCVSFVGDIRDALDFS